MELTWLAARSSRKGWAVACRFLREEGAGSEGKRGGRAAPKEPSVQGEARIGRSRDVPVRRCRSCRSRQAASDSEKRAFSTSPDLGNVRGRGSSPWQASERQKRSAATAGEGAPRVESKRKPIT
jgi:hypothetical protein